MIGSRTYVDFVLFIHFFIQLSVYSLITSVQFLPIQQFSAICLLTLCPQCSWQYNNKTLQEELFLGGVIYRIVIFNDTVPCS
jgi:predicted membrane metal-binding protein